MAETGEADESAADVAVGAISPQAWRLLRTAAGYEQRTVEKELDGLMQAHISMLENETRSLSNERLEQLYDLYTAELTDQQVRAIVEHF
ncbi:MAG: transcriptional regulator with XRE-family HTH domain [Haloarculaceae archaeon]|jgi:transcriptional regulator with XRE-family HTH domain